MIKNRTDITYLKLGKLFNCWLRSNYNSVKKNLDILLKIYLKITEGKIINYDESIPKDIKDDDKITETEFKKFMNSWISKNNPDKFELQFFYDFENYILKKYNK